MTKVTNDPPGGGPLGEFLQVQADFQTRMAEETMRYLRRLQGVLEPHAPGTVVRPGDDVLTASGAAGGRVGLVLHVENCQRVHTTVTPALTPLVATDGTTWFPDAEVTPPTRLIAPDEVVEVTLDLALPDALAPGTYRGVLVLRGFRAGDVPVSVEVTAP